MNRCILVSIKPKWVKKILKGEKTLEIRRTFPTCNLPVDVYIYCSKDKSFIAYKDEENRKFILNGKIVAKFTLNKIERVYIERYGDRNYYTTSLTQKELLDKSCLTFDEMREYLEKNDGYAWQIEDLEKFDETLELSDFYIHRDSYGKINAKARDFYREVIDRAPQSWCYVERGKRV